MTTNDNSNDWILTKCVSTFCGSKLPLNCKLGETSTVLKLDTSQVQS